MTDLVLHPITQSQIDEFIAAPSHAVMLIGPIGSGKKTLAERIAEEVLELPPGSYEDYPYKVTIAPEEDKKAISIEAIRALEHFLSLKVPRQAANNRAIIVQDAQLLTLEAQNAFLKTLEEPPKGTVIILGVHNEQSLLPTIRSRAQAIFVKRPERATVDRHFQAAKKHDSKTINQAYAISGGLPGLMHALLNEADHPLMAATEKARQLLSQTAYERLLSVDELSKQRPLALDISFILQQMAHVSLQTASGAAAKKWQNVLSASYEAAEALAANAQPKLVLTRLMTSF